MDEVDINEVNDPLFSGLSFTAKITIRKTAVYLVALAVATGAVSLVLISPFLLLQLGRTKGINWTRLSNIGQTYGAASAILSAAALLGVSLSLLVQARQARTERTRIARERHMELLRIIQEAPDVYYPVIGTRIRSAVDTRRHLFSTMWMNYASIGFQMGVISEEDLRQDILQSAFEGEPMRKWWTVTRKYWRVRSPLDHRERKFIRIVDDEYRKAVAAGPPIVLDAEDASPNTPTMTAKSVAAKRHGILKGAILGMVIGIALGSHQWPKRR